MLKFNAEKLQTDESTRTSFREEQIHKRDETENTWNYGKLCEIKGWGLKDFGNDDKVKDSLDLNSLTHKK